MKRIKEILLSAILMAGFGFGLTACVGYVDGGPGYYGHDHWGGGPWMGGPRGFVGVDVHARRR